MSNQYIIYAVTIVALLILTILYSQINNKQSKNKLKEKIKNLEQELNETRNDLDKQQSIPDFMLEQKDNSKIRYKELTQRNVFEYSTEDPLEVHIALFRAYYFNAELMALKWVDNKDKYWLTLFRGLEQALKTFGNKIIQKELAQKNKTISILEKKLLQPEPLKAQGKLLEKTQNSSTEIQSSVNEVIKQNNAKAESIQNLSLLKNNKSYTEHINNLKNSVSGSNDNIDNLQKKINALMQGISFLKNLKSDAVNGDADNIDQALFTDNSVNIESTKKVLEQLQILRANNTEQRNFIIQLRNEISTLEQETQSTDLSDDELLEKAQEIDQLERVIKEFEYCIYSLESEIDLLHSQLEELSSKESVNTKEHAVQSPAEEVKQLNLLLEQTMQMYSDLSLLSELAAESAKCEKIIDLLVVVNSSFISLGATCAFYIKTEISNNKSIPDDFLSTKEEAKLCSPKLITEVKQCEIGNKVFFEDPYFSIITGNFPADLERKTQIIDTVSLMKNIVVSEIKRIESTLINSRQNKTLTRLLSATQKELVDIDSHLNNQSIEYLNIFESLFEQVKQLENLSNVTPEVSLIVHNLVEEIESRSHMFESGDCVVSLGFKSLIDSLEKKLEKKSRSK